MSLGASLARAARVVALSLGLASLAACSNMKLVYSQAPELAYWWVDDYADFEGNQKVQAREALKAFFRWHRSSQLTDYSGLLNRLQVGSGATVTGPQVCGWYEEALAKTDVATDRALPAAVSLARTLTPEQLQHMAERFEKKNRTWIDDHLQDDPQDRVKAALKRATSRAELVYGSISSAQREHLKAGLATSPFDPRMTLAERRARQQELLSTLRKVSSGSMSVEESTVALKAVVMHYRRSPDEAYRALRERQATHDCAVAAELHNSTDTSQRAAAAKRFAGWQDDIRSLTAAVASAP